MLLITVHLHQIFLNWQKNEKNLTFIIISSRFICEKRVKKRKKKQQIQTVVFFAKKKKKLYICTSRYAQKKKK